MKQFSYSEKKIEDAGNFYHSFTDSLSRLLALDFFNEKRNGVGIIQIHPPYDIFKLSVQIKLKHNPIPSHSKYY